ncbi:hypothetical protein [Burkholderia sp. BCC1644]|uniref:hypothetical protein n=1 Tax=Burkholderia sp. BCC1644 TaxID=2676293 RepID=UPI001590496D|nr:hypothetical protein [Burkholderia sp. BCC1644]
MSAMRGGRPVGRAVAIAVDRSRIARTHPLDFAGGSTCSAVSTATAKAKAPTMGATDADRAEPL